MIDVFYFDKTVKRGDFAKLKVPRGAKVWVDVTGITKDESVRLQEAFKLHPLTTEDLLNAPIRIKVEEFPEYLFFAFYGVRHRKAVEFVELDFVIQPSGRVKAVRVNGQGRGAMPICVLNRMQSFGFPAYKGKNTIASWSMSFR